MSPAEMHEHPVTAGNPASRGTRNPQAEAEKAAAMPIAEAAAMLIVEVAAETAAGKRGNEEFQ